jgi:hypothetical protein
MGGEFHVTGETLDISDARQEFEPACKP